MADSEQLQLEWSMLQTSEWSLSDLQLAAELGKTLLERNKELESALRQHQNIVEDQAQEIEYLRKQTAALREVNDSRLRIYEQLEVSIQELETNNHRLTTQSINDKKHIASLEGQVEKLEGRCEELLRRVEDYERSRNDDVKGDNENKCDSESHALKEQLSEVRTQNSRQLAKLTELQDTIDTVTQENLRLEEQVLIMQRKQEEMAVLDQVRQGEICRRCLRAQEEMSMTGDEDDASIIDSLINDDNYQSMILRESLGELGETNNPYRILVEKYEALLRVQNQRTAGVIRPHMPDQTKCLSLQEELELSGEFSSFHREEDDGQYEVAIHAAKTQSTPDFSEAETSSSGFSDEAINKSTQTEAHIPPGSFLCSITDGDDCKFSIYDEASPIETRFRKTPEYRRLFREIFDVLKRAAEAKDEGENLPLLEDLTPMLESAPKVPPATPSVEDVTIPQVTETKPVEPVKRDILEHLSQGIGGSSKKHKSRKQKRAAANADHPPVVNVPAVGVVVNSGKGPRRRREYRQRSVDSERSTPDFSKRSTWCCDGVAQSSAIHEVAKLKQLDKSYAEVLRQGRQMANRK